MSAGVVGGRSGFPGAEGAGRRPLRRLLPPLALAALLAALPACGGEQQTEPDASSSQITSTRTLGLAYLEENRLEEAEGQFEKLIEMAPEEALGHANLGLVRLRMGELEAAETSLRRARELAPDQPRVNLILARLLEATDRTDRAREVLRESLEANPEHVKTLYALAELARSAEGEGAPERRRDYLRRIVEASPENVAARLELAGVLLRLGDGDAAAAQLEEVRQVMAELPEAARGPHGRALEAARRGERGRARDALAALRGRLEVTGEYQRWKQQLGGPVGTLEGYPVLTFSRDLEQQLTEAGAVLEALTFTDATGAAGLAAEGADGGGPAADPATRVPLATADVDGDGDVELVAPASDGGPRTAALYENDLGVFAEVPDSVGLSADSAGVRAAEVADVDNDGRLDVYLVRDGPNLLYRQTSDGGFRQVAGRAGVDDAGDGRDAVFADLDHDGDLDLYVVNEGADRYYRNDLDGGFTERTERAGLGGPPGADGREATFGYFDGDAVLDLVVAGPESGVVLYRSRRPGRFERTTAGRGGSALAAGDVDNDGAEELFVGGPDGGGRLLQEADGGGFTPDGGTTGLSALDGIAVRDAEFLDVDNDGWLDLVVAGRAAGGGRSVLLLHNVGDGRFEEISDKLPAGGGGAVSVATMDYNDDGDVDLLLADGGGRTRLLRNDGGNANRHLGLSLVGLGIGSGKVNHFGIGSRVEIRAGGRRQARTVREPGLHFGLARERSPELVRIRWTNGVPQPLYLAAGDQAAVQDQTLKGSCAFLYTWNGEETTFVTDVIWRSALGMPVGIMAGGGRSYAPADASREFVHVPGEKLEPRDGAYELKVTEELWETAYVDELRLVTVDHPDSVQLYLDGRFRPSSAPPDDRVYAVSRPRAPASARTGDGANVLPELRRSDDVHVTDFSLGRYQGLAELHDLVLDPGRLPEDEPVFLFMSGWVYPTDASINVAASQSDSVRIVPPRVQVRDGEGRWRTVVENMSFPAGKEKTVVVELTDRFLSSDRRVRIRTNLQVYWDRAFFATGDLRADLRRTSLSPADAELGYHGFSRLYRKGGRHGPHWFDYDSVRTSSPWLPIEGPFTRYGDVTSMLQAPDDRYVVAGPGDEISVRFDASAAPELPDGWSRDFLLYSDGWIKDADLNTATGHRVEPLPFHGMPHYPYGSGVRPPGDSVHRSFLERTLTRDAPGPR